MRRISVALLCTCTFLFAVGLAADADPQKGSKRPAPAGAPVTGRAVERDSGQSGERGSGRAVERKGQASQRGGERTTEVKAGVVVRSGGPDAWRDGDHCRLIVTDYYDRRTLPPGLAKKGKLPPGLRRQLRERGHLPPGLEKHWVVLPVELERRLPPLPPHYVRRGIGADLLVIDTRSNVVVSIMAGVFISR